MHDFNTKLVCVSFLGHFFMFQQVCCEVSVSEFKFHKINMIFLLYLDFILCDSSPFSQRDNNT